MKSELEIIHKFTVSPLIGQELAKNAVTALLASIGIIIYVSLRFEWRMGLSSDLHYYMMYLSSLQSLVCLRK